VDGEDFAVDAFALGDGGCVAARGEEDDVHLVG